MAALAPLFVLWLGFGLGPKVTIAALISFFPLLENTIVGLRRVDPDALKLFASLGASPWQVFVKLRLPHGLPYILTGLKVGVVFATVGAVIAEFVTSNKGLGALIMQAQGNFDTKLMFAVIIVLTVMGVLLYEILQLVERWTLRIWNRRGRSTTAVPRRDRRKGPTDETPFAGCHRPAAVRAFLVPPSSAGPGPAQVRRTPVPTRCQHRVVLRRARQGPSSRRGHRDRDRGRDGRFRRCAPAGHTPALVSSPVGLPMPC
jgi:ABC-type Fe3+ transport system permease subunit